MDDPLWYAKESFFQDTIGDPLTLERLNAIVEDGIPARTMMAIQEQDGTPRQCLLGDNYIYNESNQTITLNNIGVLLGPGHIPALANPSIYFYYCGTGKEYPEISFYNNPAFASESSYYISRPRNSFASYDDGRTYNTLKIRKGGEEIDSFKFVAPDIFLSYNLAVNIILTKFSTGGSIVDLKSTLRDSISNDLIRKNALAICDVALKKGIGVNLNSGSILQLAPILNGFKRLFVPNTNDIRNEDWKCYYRIDSKTGKIQVKTTLCPINVEGNTANDFNYSPRIETEWMNAGNLARSPLLTLNTQTLPNENNRITSGVCLNIVSDTPINNFQMKYKYRYL